MKLVIVGGGLYGLSVARAAIARGHAVTVIEQGRVPDPLASSVDRHRLIRYPYGELDGYAAMIGDAFTAWDGVWRDLGRRHYVETGTLAHHFAPGDWADLSAASLDRLGIGYERLSPAELDRRFPMLSAEAAIDALWLPSGGALLADRIVGGLGDLVRARGELIEGVAVTDLDPARAAALLADGRRIEGDRLVVAAGVWTPRLIPDLAATLRPVRQVVTYAKVPEKWRAAWAAGPMLLELQPDESFYAVPPVDGYGLKVGDHRMAGGPDDPEARRGASAEEARTIWQAARRRLRDFDDYRILEAKTCLYTVTEGERFAIRPVERALVLSCCSGHGFKFGPLVGERVAAHLDGDGDIASLQRWAAGGML
ncbi:FAD-dependent oxidoreductase [Zavarzinia compransoris]|uniref:NAD(P)/FAD-dependent oxidoreductase n=1 Tax=Zavarzinia marina TaxID=2911065 RepID=UPI001F24BA6A|nr:FAD-dependent oxidoreductase [Zavarzinia marina]MCF4166077.1 FAD-dependent oxidoreductase [Zavarzinia marina]